MANRKLYTITLSTGETATKYAWNSARDEMINLVRGRMKALHIYGTIDIPKGVDMRRDIYDNYVFGKFDFVFPDGIVSATIERIA